MTTTKTCAYCGRAFQKPKKEGLVQWRTRKYCCHPCSAIASRKHPFDALDQYIIDLHTGCWNWTAGTNGVGYGVVGRHRKRFLAHRLSYQRAVGPIPPGKIVLHACDNPICINPAHLRLGTMRDNTQDMMAKRRNAYAVPGKSASGLTTKAILDIYTSSLSGRDLAKKYDISPPTISRIRRGHSWRTITGAA